MTTPKTTDYQVSGTNEKALFTLKIHRGEGMALLAMNWKNEKPPLDFVGFSIEYREPNSNKFYALRNRITFLNASKTDPNAGTTLNSPIQKFRWIHFPQNAELKGEFTYKVKPVFMNENQEISYGEAQQCSLELARETYPELNVTFTRGFVASQAFAYRYEKYGDISTIIASDSGVGLTFEHTHPKATETATRPAASQPPAETFVRHALAAGRALTLSARPGQADADPYDEPPRCRTSSRSGASSRPPVGL